VELHRTRGGAGGLAAAEPAEPADPATHASVLDFDTDDDDEPRTVVIRGFGPRWAEAPTLPGAEPLPGTTPQTPERNP
jgi:tRNA threonylcarbamoyladenosine biosynthesis protein TsaE